MKLTESQERLLRRLAEAGLKTTVTGPSGTGTGGGIRRHNWCRTAEALQKRGLVNFVPRVGRSGRDRAWITQAGLDLMVTLSK